MFAYMKGMNTDQNRITREVLTQVTFRCDQYRPYLASSPYLSNEVVKNRNIGLASENHLWGTRDYYKSSYYTQSNCHFVSEIGYHGCPNLSSIKRFIDKEHLWSWNNNRQWATHCTDPIEKGGSYSYRVQLMANQIKEMFGVSPDNIEDFIIASQISQAEAKKFFIELTRTEKWRRTGIIWWNMIDGWPEFSDAVVDYYFGKKLAYHYIKRVQQPVCLMMKELFNWHLTVVAGNDSNRDAAGHYKVWDADTGEVMLQGVFNTKANENVELGKIRVSIAIKSFT
jgi:beta-mannosidase